MTVSGVRNIRRANICAGSDVRYGWDNYDRQPDNNLVKKLDIDRPFAIDDDTYDHLVIEHGLEHTLLNQLDVMKEIHRVVKHQGKVEVELPLFSPMVCHRSSYHPSTYFNVITDKKRDVNKNYTDNWFKQISFEYAGKRNWKMMLFWMKTRFINWVNSFRYDSGRWVLEVRK